MMRIVGLISGTSADAVDAVLAEISGAPPNLDVHIIQSVEYGFSKELQQRIHAACNSETSHVDEICRLNVVLGKHFADAALQVINKAGLLPGSVDLVGAAGQTVWHDVEANGTVKATLQIAEAAEIAEKTGVTTISNFRTRDVAVGGHGAPLTAYADWLLLRRQVEWRAVQNIGGIGNVTFLPPKSDEHTQPLAFDTGPGNALIDGVTLIVTHGDSNFDRDGSIAARGHTDDAWLRELLTHPYYERRPPKTTGRELFGSEMSGELVVEGRKRGLDDESIVATVTALTAHSIADAYRRFSPASVSEVVLGGGGARNPTLVSMLAEQVAPVRVLHHEDIGFDSDFKEALVFALLAYETWHSRPGNHPALTGADKPAVLGQITPGENFVALVKQTWCGFETS